MRSYDFLLIICCLALLNACGGGGGGSGNASTSNTTPAVFAPNEMQITVEKWASNTQYPNQGYVSLQICEEQTSNCQTIDHVLVDTGSYGLRLLSSAVNLTLRQQRVNGAPLAECAHFVSGYTWGSVVLTDVTLGTEKVSSVPVQLINGNYATTPLSCSSVGGTPMNSAADLGANGILGVGSFAQDCPTCASHASPGHYYACNSPTCLSTSVPLTSQVVNPVSMLTSNNNGVVIDLPAASSFGQISLSGKLIFGIGNSSNNTTTTETVFQLDNNGNLTTTYGGVTYSQSYIDSGSNGYFFNDLSINRCTTSTGFYCPPSTLNKTAVISSGANSKSVNFAISATSNNASNFAVQPNLAGTGAAFAWGMPFFYGRKVFVSISGKAAFGSTLPSIAF